MFPHVVADEEKLRLGMVDYVRYVHRIEIRKDRHNHRPVGYGGHIRYYPAYRIASADRHLRALLEPYRLEKQVEHGNLSRQVAVSELAARGVFRESRKLPVLDETLLVNLGESLHKKPI